MQICYFEGGGYVIHRITGDFRGRVSAWFSADGTLLDAEQLTGRYSDGRRVKPGGPMWLLCQVVGLRYV